MFGRTEEVREIRYYASFVLLPLAVLSCVCHASLLTSSSQALAANVNQGWNITSNTAKLDKKWSIKFIQELSFSRRKPYNTGRTFLL